MKMRSIACGTLTGTLPVPWNNARSPGWNPACALEQCAEPRAGTLLVAWNPALWPGTLRVESSVAPVGLRQIYSSASPNHYQITISIILSYFQSRQ
jgi:hypothetical protein